MPTLKQKVVKGAIWTLLEKGFFFAPGVGCDADWRFVI